MKMWAEIILLLERLKKRFLATFLSVCVSVSLLPSQSFALRNGVNVATAVELQNAINSAESYVRTEIVLTANVELTGEINVPVGKFILITGQNSGVEISRNEEVLSPFTGSFFDVHGILFLDGVHLNGAIPCRSDGPFFCQPEVTVKFGGVFVARECVFSGNEVQGDGGTIHNSGWTWLYGCKVKNNVAYGDGGGIYNRGRLFLIKSSVNGNQAKGRMENNDYCAGNGGGIANEGAFYSFELAIHGNMASGNGGGLFNGCSTLLEEINEELEPSKKELEDFWGINSGSTGDGGIDKILSVFRLFNLGKERAKKKALLVQPLLAFSEYNRRCKDLSLFNLALPQTNNRSIVNMADKDSLLCIVDFFEKAFNVNFSSDSHFLRLLFAIYNYYDLIGVNPAKLEKAAEILEKQLSESADFSDLISSVKDLKIDTVNVPTIKDLMGMESNFTDVQSLKGLLNGAVTDGANMLNTKGLMEAAGLSSTNVKNLKELLAGAIISGTIPNMKDVLGTAGFSATDLQSLKGLLNGAVTGGTNIPNIESLLKAVGFSDTGAQSFTNLLKTGNLADLNMLNIKKVLRKELPNILSNMPKPVLLYGLVDKLSGVPDCICSLTKTQFSENVESETGLQALAASQFSVGVSVLNQAKNDWIEINVRDAQNIAKSRHSKIAYMNFPWFIDSSTVGAVEDEVKRIVDAWDNWLLGPVGSSNMVELYFFDRDQLDWGSGFSSFDFTNPVDVESAHLLCEAEKAHLGVGPNMAAQGNDIYNSAPCIFDSCQFHGNKITSDYVQDENFDIFLQGVTPRIYGELKLEDGVNLHKIVYENKSNVLFGLPPVWRAATNWGLRTDLGPSDLICNLLPTYSLKQTTKAHIVLPDADVYSDESLQLTASGHLAETVTLANGIHPESPRFWTNATVYVATNGIEPVSAKLLDFRSARPVSLASDIHISKSEPTRVTRDVSAFDGLLTLSAAEKTFPTTSTGVYRVNVPVVKENHYWLALYDVNNHLCGKTHIYLNEAGLVIFAYKVDEDGTMTPIDPNNPTNFEPGDSVKFVVIGAEEGKPPELVDSNGNPIIWELKNVGSHFEVFFTPEESGSYTVSASNPMGNFEFTVNVKLLPSGDSSGGSGDSSGSSGGSSGSSANASGAGGIANPDRTHLIIDGKSVKNNDHGEFALSEFRKSFEKILRNPNSKSIFGSQSINKEESRISGFDLSVESLLEAAKERIAAENAAAAAKTAGKTATKATVATVKTTTTKAATAVKIGMQVSANVNSHRYFEPDLTFPRGNSLRFATTPAKTTTTTTTAATKTTATAKTTAQEKQAVGITEEEIKKALEILEQGLINLNTNVVSSSSVIENAKKRYPQNVVNGTNLQLLTFGRKQTFPFKFEVFVLLDPASQALKINLPCTVYQIDSTGKIVAVLSSKEMSNGKVTFKIKDTHYSYIVKECPIALNLPNKSYKESKIKSFVLDFKTLQEEVKATGASRVVLNEQNTMAFVFASEILASKATGTVDLKMWMLDPKDYGLSANIMLLDLGNLGKISCGATIYLEGKAADKNKKFTVCALNSAGKIVKIGTCTANANSLMKLSVSAKVTKAVGKAKLKTASAVTTTAKATTTITPSKATVTTASKTATTTTGEKA
ncbi:MAG: hypothetical protein LBJ83_00655 [Oscillospiraceae bacterium]|nr:hypothetical protein [Oscillospiraceae bacterium]